MNILMVSPRFPPEGGGLEEYAKDVCNGLFKAGHKITVLCSTYGKKDITEEINGIKIIRQKSDFLISNTPIKITLLRNLNYILKSEKFDVVNAHMPVAYYSDMTALAAKANKIPFVVTYHSSSLIKGRIFVDLTAFAYKCVFQNITLNIADRIIAVSNYVKNVTLKQYKNKTDVVYPCRNFHKTDNSGGKGEYVSDLIFIGQLRKGHEWKGLKYLLKAVSVLKTDFPFITLEVVGGGNRLDYFKKYAVALGMKDNVIFKGKVLNDEIASFYKHSKIVAVPSYSAESFGMVCLEACYYKKPVVATKVGGIPEVITDGVNGYLVKPRDVRGLVDALKTLLVSDEKRKIMGERGNKLIKSKFDYGNFIKTTEEILLKTTKRSNSL
ncbi:MAG: glycosyltransferase family 4 protein [bacterium]|nr:glycosyltransferase family 4 protein [bacterium]